MTPILTGESPFRKRIDAIMSPNFSIIPSGSIGVCIPEKCSAEMWRQIFNTFAQKHYIRIDPNNDFCQTSKEMPYDIVDKIGMLVFCKIY